MPNDNRPNEIPATSGRLVVHALTLIIGIWMAFSPTLMQGLLQTDPGDTLLNHYILEHSWQCVSNRDYQFHLWSPGCFYPAEMTLAYSENLLGAAPIYWLARLGLGEVASFQTWMIVSAMMTYVSMAWVLSRFGVSTWLAALGAAAFAFGLPQVNQLCHQQLLPAMYCPLAVYWLWRFFGRPTIARLVVTMLLTLLQLWSSIYLGWLLCLALGIFTVAALILVSSIRNDLLKFARSRWPAILGVLAFVSLFAWPLVARYLEANRGFHRSYRHEVRELLPRPESWLSPPTGSIWANCLTPLAGPLSHEHHLFPGAVFIVMLGWAGWRCFRDRTMPPLAKAALVTTVVLALVSMRLGKYSAWRQIYSIAPGAAGIRAVTRIYSVVLLMGWLGVLVAISHELRRRPRVATIAGAILLVLGLAEQYQPRLPAFDRHPFFTEVERLANEMRDAPAAYVELDPAQPYWTGQLTAMWAGLRANVPVVNGYSGRVPAGYPDEKSCQTRMSLALWLGQREVRMIPRLQSNGNGQQCPNTLTRQ